MKVETKKITTVTLDEKDIKEAIRKHLIDKGVTSDLKENEISLYEEDDKIVANC